MFEMLDHNGACHFGSSFALGSLNPICVKNPPTHTKVGGYGGRARQTTEGGLSGVQGGRGKVAEATGGHPGGQGNPLSHPGGSYVTVEDLADRWNTPAAARENGPRDLGFQDGENGFNARASFRQFGWQPTWSGGGTKVTTRRVGASWNDCT